MADNIVARLRGLNAASYHLLCNEAADEIERLRAESKQWRDLAEYVCRNVPSIAIPEEIARLFPDPLEIGHE